MRQHQNMQRGVPSNMDPKHWGGQEGVPGSDAEKMSSNTLTRVVKCHVKNMSVQQELSGTSRKGNDQNLNNKMDSDFVRHP